MDRLLLGLLSRCLKKGEAGIPEIAYNLIRHVSPVEGVVALLDTTEGSGNIRVLSNYPPKIKPNISKTLLDSAEFCQDNLFVVDSVELPQSFVGNDVWVSGAIIDLGGAALYVQLREVSQDIIQFLPALRDFVVVLWHMIRSNRNLTRYAKSIATGKDLIFRSKAIQNVIDQIANYIEFIDDKNFDGLPVLLLLGETGTGKTHLARHLIPALTKRYTSNFVYVSVPSLHKESFVAEFWGVGAKVFTDVLERQGYVRLADQGILFLDEIGDFPLDNQPLLNQFIDSGVYRRVGETDHEMKADTLIVAATLYPENELRQRLRPDLYHRIARFSVRIPPLRERPEDIEALLDAFGASLGVKIRGGLRTKLLEYEWPGNIRELRSFVERLAARLRPPKGHLVRVDSMEYFESLIGV